MIKSGINKVLVKVNDRLVREIEMGAKNLILDPSYDVYRNTKITAKVVSVPETIASTVLYEEYVGFPYPTRVDDTGKRHPIDFTPKMAVNEGPPLVEPGDTIYFHYLSLSKNNYLCQSDDGLDVYMIGYEQIFCRVRKGIIKMLNGFIAVTPFWDDGYEDVEFPAVSVTGDLTGETRKLRVKQSKGGIIYDINETPLFRTGTLEMKSDAPDKKDYIVDVGDRIIYTDFSEFKNTIEGKEYYIMKLWSIVAVYKRNSMVPMMDYVLIDVTPAKKSFLIIPEKYKRAPDEGVVLSKGSEVEELEVGDTVKFSLHNKMFIDIDGLKGTFVREKEVFAKKSKD